MRVFLSYHHNDARTAAMIRKTLERARFEVWDPIGGLLPGDNLHEALATALRSAQAIVVLLSPEAIDDPSFRHEISYALGESRFDGRLVPVVIRPVPKVPWILGKLQVLDIHSDVKRGSRRIVEALRRKPTAA